jgi:atypical dual specificity phosphatase
VSADSIVNCQGERLVIEYLRFNWLVPGKLAGGPHPELSGGLAAVAPFLRTQGVGAIVTLYETPLDPPPEQFGFRSLFVQTPNFEPPADFGAVLHFIHQQHEQGQGVLVHCFAGIGRTGIVLAAWLLQKNHHLSAAAAIARVRDEYIPGYARTRFPEHVSQADALERFARER